MRATSLAPHAEVGRARGQGMESAPLQQHCPDPLHLPSILKCPCLVLLWFKPLRSLESETPFPPVSAK